MSPAWDSSWWYLIRMTYVPMQGVIRMTCNVALCHPDEINNLTRKSSVSQYLIRMTYGHYRMSPEWLNVIWTVSHPDELDSDRISYGWLMTDTSCHLDDLAGFGISSGWVTTNSLCHRDHTPFHLMSSGWLNWGWYLIWMSNGNVIMSSGWDTLPFLSHPDDITNFDFSQRAVARQRFRSNAVHRLWNIGQKKLPQTPGAPFTYTDWL